MANFTAAQPEQDIPALVPSDALEWVWEHRRALVAGALIAAALLLFLPRNNGKPLDEFATDDAALFI